MNDDLDRLLTTGTKGSMNNEHDRLLAACERLLAAVAPDYAGDIPDALVTLADIIRDTGVPVFLRDALENK